MDTEIGKKVREIHDFIQNSFYLSYEDMKLGGEKYNSYILLSIMTGLNRGNQLITGNYGQGKTTVSEAVSSLIYAYPPEFVEACEVKGHPFQTEEKIFGRPNLGKLNKGEEDVVWSNFSLFAGPKIIDEINRLPEATQNTLLNTVDRGTVQYLNKLLKMEKYPLFATANYPDGGNGQIIKPLIDRFDVCTETAAPVGLVLNIKAAHKLKNNIKNHDICHSMLTEYSASNLSTKKIDDLRDEYRNHLREQSKNIGWEIPFMEKEELAEFENEYKKHEMGVDSNTLLDVFFSEINSIVKIRGENKQDDKRYEKFTVGKINNNLSTRWINSILKYSMTAAYIEGSDEVTSDLLFRVLPFTLCHRIEFKDKYTLANLKDEFYSGSQQRYSTDCIIRDFDKTYRQDASVYTSFLSKVANDESIDSFETTDLPALKTIMTAKKMAK